MFCIAVPHSCFVSTYTQAVLVLLLHDGHFASRMTTIISSTSIGMLQTGQIVPQRQIKRSLSLLTLSPPISTESVQSEPCKTPPSF
jgi:hypothetical protein